MEQLNQFLNDCGRKYEKAHVSRRECGLFFRVDNECCYAESNFGECLRLFTDGVKFMKIRLWKYGSEDFRPTEHDFAVLKAKIAYMRENGGDHIVEHRLSYEDVEVADLDVLLDSDVDELTERVKSCLDQWTEEKKEENSRASDESWKKYVHEDSIDYTGKGIKKLTIEDFPYNYLTE